MSWLLLFMLKSWEKEVLNQLRAWEHLFWWVDVEGRGCFPHSFGVLGVHHFAGRHVWSSPNRINGCSNVNVQRQDVFHAPDHYSPKSVWQRVNCLTWVLANHLSGAVRIWRQGLVQTYHFPECHESAWALAIHVASCHSAKVSRGGSDLKIKQKRLSFHTLKSLRDKDTTIQKLKFYPFCCYSVGRECVTIYGKQKTKLLFCIWLWLE